MIEKSLPNNKAAEHVSSLNMGIMLLAFMLISVMAMLAKLFSLIDMLSLVIVLVSTFVLYMFINAVVMRRYVFKPLTKLAESVSQISGADADNVEVYGKERSDEIGDLSRTIQHMLDTLRAKNFDLQNMVVEQDAYELNKKEREAQAALKHREMLLNTVNRATEILLTASEENTMTALTASMRIVGRCVGADHVQIWRNEMIDGELHFTMCYEWLSEFGKQKKGVPIGLKVPYSSRPGWLEMFMKGKCINTPISKLPPDDAAFLGHFGVVSIVILPLFLNEEFFGFFSLVDCRQERVFTNDEMDIFASAGLMFTNVFNRNMQRELAFTDALTGLRNRRYLMEAGEQELRNCIEKNMDFAVIMIDVDHFKLINDFFGHTVGDAVLKILTARLCHVLKHNTLLSRYGGEEFVVTLPGVEHEDAVKTAWRMQKAIEDSAFLIEDLTEVNVTSSFGVASKTVRCTTLSDIINKADSALYQAKKAGRNTVVACKNA